jgi:hypothetical protein
MQSYRCPIGIGADWLVAWVIGIGMGTYSH